MVAQVINYSFTPGTRKVVFKDVQIVDTTKIQYIYNKTRDVMLYTYITPTALSTDGKNVVTISHSTAGMLYSDDLLITYDFPVEPVDSNRYFL